MGTKDIQSVFSACRNLARKNNPKGVPAINKLERICLANYEGKMSSAKARVAMRQVLFDHNLNPTMLDMAEVQAKSSKMIGPVPDVIPSTQGKSVVGLLNQKQVKQKAFSYSGGIFANVNLKQSKPVAFMGKPIKQVKQKGLIFSPSIVGGKVNNNKSIFEQFSSKKQIQSKGIFKGINLNQKASSGKGIFSGINVKQSKSITFNFKQPKSKSNNLGIFSGVKQSKKSSGKSIVDLMNGAKK